MTTYHALAIPLPQRRQMFKEAGAVRSAIDSGWNSVKNNVVNPAWNAVAGGAAQGVNTAMAIPRAILGAGQGAVSGASQGLGGFAQGAVDGAYNSGADTIAQTKANFNRVVGGGTPQVKSMAQAVPPATGAFNEAGEAAFPGIQGPRPPVDGGLGAAAGNIVSFNGAPPGATGGLASSIPSLNAAPPASTGGLAGMGLSSSIPALNGAPSASTGGGLGAVSDNIATASRPDYQALFRKNHGTAFDPHSSMDRRKMQQLQGGGQMMAKGAGIKDLIGGLEKALARGRRAYDTSRPTEGILAGAKHAVSGAKSSVAESLGGSQKIDGAHSLRSGIARAGLGLASSAGKALPSADTSAKVGIGAVGGLSLRDLLESAGVHGADTKAARDPAPTIDKAAMEKVALAQLLGKGLGAAGSKLKSMGSAAKGLAGRAAYDAADGPLFKEMHAKWPAQTFLSEPFGGAGRLGNEASKLVGNKRIGLGKTLSEAGKTLATDAGLQKKVNIGLGAVGGGAALVGANQLGASTGKAEGLQEGKTKGLAQGAGEGYNAGVADSNSMQASMDPGIMGRLLEVFTGRQPQMLDTADKQMAARRQQTLQRLLSGN